MTWQTIVLAAIFIYWIGVGVVLVAEDRDPSTTLAWIFVLILMPYLGILVYYFVGRDWARLTRDSKWLRTRESIRLPFMRELWRTFSMEDSLKAGSNQPQVVSNVATSIIGQIEVPPLLARDVDIWPSGESYFPNLLEDISRAKESIHMQYFIWEEDELTDQFIDVLIERCKAGVEVRILNDLFGCMMYSKKGLKRLQDAGGTVLSDVTSINKANYRNHRKITVIDGALAHTGGVNIGQEYIDGGSHYNSWRDTGMRFSGPAVISMQDLFAQRWFEVAGESLYLAKYFPVMALGSGDVLTHTVSHGVEDEWRAGARAHEVAISTCKQYVWLQSPYYVPTEGMEEALTNAALRGVDVRLMITGVPDKKIAWYAAFSYFSRLLKAGAKVYLYEPGFFHAKSIVVDGCASAVGTMNLDTRSLYLHKELMIWMYSDKYAEINKQIFLDDMEMCREVTPEELSGFKFRDRFRNSMYRLVSRLL